MGSENEIERRWIIETIPDQITHSIRREVGYVFNKDGEMRIVKKYKPNDTKYLITIKTDGTLTRKEWQERIPEWAMKVAWPRTRSRRLEITRHFADYHGNVLEIDEYHGRFNGLIKLEIEFGDETDASAFVLPSWIGRAWEVTTDIRFNNKNMAAMKKAQAKALIKETKEAMEK